MSKNGKALARSVLDSLLRKAERAWAQQATRDHAVVFTEASLPAYFTLPLREDKAAAHAELREAERTGAIAIEWDRRAGVDGQVNRVRLLDPEKIAVLLGEMPAWHAYAQAEAALGPWHSMASVQNALARWRAGKAVRGLRSSDVQDVIDGCRVIEACRRSATVEDIPIRRLSAALFADSKRIESIGAALDVLTAESVDVPWREIEDVLTGLGLVKLPQPILLAGTGRLELSDGSCFPIPQPYIGLAPQSIEGLRFDDVARYVLTVENLTTFHELALEKAGKLRGLVVYTAGMPSPAFLGAYQKLIRNLATYGGISRYHWGDIDLGDSGSPPRLRVRMRRLSGYGIWIRPDLPTARLAKISPMMKFKRSRESALNLGGRLWLPTWPIAGEQLNKKRLRSPCPCRAQNQG